MGVDLTMLPFDCDSLISFSHTVLDCERRRELWDAIGTLPQIKVTKGFTSFYGTVPDGKFKGERMYGATEKHSYGDWIRYTTVEELMTLREHVGVTDNYKNRAIWAYLAELPPETKVAFYWH